MSRPRRILHVIATLDRGGTEVSCHALAAGMHANGFENHVVALVRGESGIEGAFTGVAIEHGALPSGRVSRMWAFATLLRKQRPDAVLFHYFNLDHVTLGMVAWVLGVRRMSTRQGNPAPMHRGLRRKVSLILATSRLFGISLVSASRWIEDTMREIGPLPKGSVVVHNGSEVSDIATRADVARSKRSHGPFIVGMIARLDPIKDHTTLIEAMSRLPEIVRGRSVHLHLVGDGALRDAIAAKAKNLGISEHLVFRGAQADVAAELGGWDVFVLSTTRDEGFGVVLVEALAAGVPIVASDVPACREVLEYGGLGRLVAAADPAALANAIQDTLLAPPAVPSMAEIEVRYGTGTMAISYAKVLFG